MSILTDEDRAGFDTPQKRMSGTTQAIMLMVQEFGLTRDDVNYCRAETNRIASMMIGAHARYPGAGKHIDDIRAMCDVLDAVLTYTERQV